VDDFYFVGFADGGVGPVFAADDAVVYFDRDALLRLVEMLQESVYIDAFGDDALFAVHNYLHRVIIPFWRGFRNDRELESGVWGLGSGVWSLGFGVSNLRFGI
jgi:hypothetical protein